MSMQLASSRANISYIKLKVYERGDLKLEDGGARNGLALCAALMLEPYSLLREVPAKETIPANSKEKGISDNAVIDRRRGWTVPVNEHITRRIQELKIEKDKVSEYANLDPEAYTAVEDKPFGFHECPLRAGLRICTILRFDPFDLLPMDEDVWQPSWEPIEGKWHALMAEDGSIVSYQFFDEIFTNRRRQMRMTQFEIAKRAGVTLRNYQRFEARDYGFCNRGVESVLAVCSVMGLDPYMLIKAEKQLNREKTAMKTEVEFDRLKAWMEP